MVNCRCDLVFTYNVNTLSLSEFLTDVHHDKMELKIMPNPKEIAASDCCGVNTGDRRN